jgi:hypothetical protein
MQTPIQPPVVGLEVLRLLEMLMGLVELLVVRELAHRLKALLAQVLKARKVHKVRRVKAKANPLTSPNAFGVRAECQNFPATSLGLVRRVTERVPPATGSQARCRGSLPDRAERDNLPFLRLPRLKRLPLGLLLLLQLTSS